MSQPKSHPIDAAELLNDHGQPALVEDMRTPFITPSKSKLY